MAFLRLLLQLLLCVFHFWLRFFRCCFLVSNVSSRMFCCSAPLLSCRSFSLIPFQEIAREEAEKTEASSLVSFFCCCQATGTVEESQRSWSRLPCHMCFAPGIACPRKSSGPLPPCHCSSSMHWNTLGLCVPPVTAWCHRSSIPSIVEETHSRIQGCKHCSRKVGYKVPPPFHIWPSCLSVWPIQSTHVHGRSPCSLHRCPFCVGGVASRSLHLCHTCWDSRHRSPSLSDSSGDVYVAPSSTHAHGHSPVFMSHKYQKYLKQS